MATKKKATKRSSSKSGKKVPAAAKKPAARPRPSPDDEPTVGVITERITAGMKRMYGEWSPEGARDSFTEAEQELYNRIHDTFADLRETQLWAGWELARDLHYADIGARDPASGYGERLVPRLAAALGKDPQHMRTHIRVYECWSSKESFRKNVVECLDGLGMPLDWTAVSFLATISDEKWRNKLRDKVLEEGLSVREMIACHRAVVQPALNASPGRLPAPPRSVGTWLVQTSQTCVTMSRKCQHGLLGERFDFEQNIREMPDSEVGPALVDGIREAKKTVNATREWLEALSAALSAGEAAALERM